MWPCHEKNSTRKNNAMRIEFENQRVETLEYFEKLKNRKSKGVFQESLKQRRVSRELKAKGSFRRKNKNEQKHYT